MLKFLIQYLGSSGCLAIVLIFYKYPPKLYLFWRCSVHMLGMGEYFAAAFHHLDHWFCFCKIQENIAVGPSSTTLGIDTKITVQKDM